MNNLWNWVWIVLCLVAAVSLVIVLSASAGYAVTKFEREARCVNSACSDPCKPSARFVRHAGCLK